MNIKQIKEYETATQNIINHIDKKFFENHSIDIFGYKTRKIDNKIIHNWSDLKFKIAFKNLDMQYKSIGGYRNIKFDKSSFIDWISSVYEAWNYDNCFDENITIKRRIGDDDLLVRFAISKKYNDNVVIIGINNSKSGYIYVGMDNLLFNQYMKQLNRITEDLINYDMSFDNLLHLYKNNQYLEYIINNQYLTNQNNVSSIVEENIISEENNAVQEIININDDVTEIEKNDEKIIQNEKIIDENQNEFLDKLDEKIEKTELVPLLKNRQDYIDNDLVVENEEETSNIISAVKERDINISIFVDIFKQYKGNKISIEDCFSLFYQKVFDNDKEYKYPHCSELDNKSVFYLSRYQYLCYASAILENKDIEKIESFHIKYDLKEKLYLEEIKDIYDLISIQLYLNVLHKKLKNRNSNFIENKGFFCEFYRFIFEPYYLSYLVTLPETTDIFERTILNHYNHLKELNFFTMFDSLLDEYSLNKISDKEIKFQILSLKDVVIDNRKSLLEIHKDLINQSIVKLPYKNKFNKEHINDICLYEISLGKGKKSKQFLEEFISKNNIKNEDIIKYLILTYKENTDEVSPDVLNDLANINTKIVKNKESSLYRYINNYLDNNVEYKKKLLTKVKLIGENNLKIDDLKDFNLHQLPENILIALHNWRNIEQNEDLKKYTTFIKIVDTSIESKNDILAVYIAERENVITDNKETSGDDWSCIFS